MTEVICTCCPKGCHLMVDEENNYEVTGYGCKRGQAFGAAELLHPMRIVTSTVHVEGAGHPSLPVKTADEVPREKMLDIVAALRGLTVTAPVKVGDVVLANAADTGVNVVATRSM